ncbi:MAG: thioredoxin [bacterium]
MSKEIVINDANFQKEVLESDVPVLVDFWAPWCSPCRMMGPVVEELASDYDGKVKVGKLNTDENPKMAGEYGVISIPTIIIFKDGKPNDQIIGVVPKGTIAKKLDSLLSK